MDTTRLSTAIISAIAAYLASPSAKPHRADVDQALWDHLQALLKSHPELLTEFKAKPHDARLQGKVESKMEDALNGNPVLHAALEGLLQKSSEKDASTGGTQVSGVNNVVNSNLQAGGDIHIGNVEGSPRRK